MRPESKPPCHNLIVESDDHGRCTVRIDGPSLRHVQTRTLLAVSQAIVNHQHKFIATGDVEDLRPLAMREVASAIGMAECTVSRQVRRRYLCTPHGRYPLSRFFVSRLDSDDGQGASSMFVRSRVADLIAHEDTSRPLSDAKIAGLLRLDGVHVSRRAVAKYRLNDGIPAAHERRAVRVA